MVAQYQDNSADVARRAIEANQSPRYRRIDRLDRYVETTQYEGKPPFWDDDKPLFDKAPAVVWPIVDDAISSHVSMVLGEGRFPEITSGQDEDDSDFDSVFGLDEDESQILDKFLVIVGRQTRWRVVFANMLRMGMAGKSACLVAGILNGKLTLSVVPAKWCTPKFKQDDPSADVESIEIRYGYTQEEKDPNTQHVTVKALLYRRVINDESDTTYLPVEAPSTGAEPQNWQVDTKKSVKHSLGFCPVRWYRYMCRVSIAGEIDGHAIHEKLLDEITCWDYGVSQVTRANMYTVDPILLEIGVDRGFNPTELGDKRSIMVKGDDEAMDQWKVPASAAMAGSGGKGRKRGPGIAYQYPERAKIDYLTLPVGALESASKNNDALFGRIAESLHWLPIDPKDLMNGKELSGKALEMIFMRQIKYDDEVRTDFGDHALLPAIDLVLRIVATVGAKSKDGLYLAGLDKVLPILAKFQRKQTQTDGSVADKWMPPDFRLKWPAYFAATAADAKSDGDNVRADLGAGIINQKTAVKRMAKHHDIDDPATYADDLEAEAEKKKADDMAAQHEASAHLQQAALARRGAGKAPPGAPQAPATSPAAARAPAERQPPTVAKELPTKAPAKPPKGRLGAGRLTARRDIKAAA